MPEDTKSASGLHATAKVFVPVYPKSDSKATEAVKPAAGATADGPPTPSISSTANAGPSSGNGAVAGSGSQSNAKGPADAAVAQQGGKGSNGGKGPKAAGNGKQAQGQSISKLAAAASAPPFVPGKAGTPPPAVTAAGTPPPTKEQQQQQQGKQQNKQGGRGNRNQQQGRQQQQREQQQQQQKEPQQPQQVKDFQQQQQKEQQQMEPSKDSSKTPTGKMSAAAAAFVPKNLQTPLAAVVPASGVSTPTMGSSANSSNSAQQQPGRPQSSSGPAAAARLKSPLRAMPVSSSAATTPSAPASQASPARSASAAGRGRGASRGSNLSIGSGPSPGLVPPGGVASMYGGPAGGYPGAGRGMAGGPGGIGGPKRALLAQFQGNYGQYGSGGFGGYQHQQRHHASGPGKQLLSGQFLSEGLRQQLQQNNYLKQLQYTPTADEPPLPEKIGQYHTLYPLEDLAAADAAGVSAAWGVRTNILKGISARDGRAYALRIVCGKQVIPSHEMLAVVRSAIDAWSCLSGQPGLLVPVDGLVSAELDGSQSLVVVHSYIPGAATLTQAHLQPTQTVSGQLIRNTPTEELLWSYTVQLAAVLRAAHATGLALRPAALSATKVLVTPVGRLKVSGLGVAESLTGEVVPQNSEDLTQLQRDDVVAMGQLLLQLACAVNSPAAPSLDFASMHYSMEFVRLLMLLLGVADGAAFNWRAVSALLGERLLLEMDSLAMFNEQLLDDLSKEIENGRLFRLVSKLGFVTDRPADTQAQAQTAAWSETGDRYLLQLFKDFVFHQGELDNGRVIDWGHIIEVLNKLDAGVSEQVLLQSRDERSLLVVSYADVKRCIESAISELRTRGNSTGTGAVGMLRPHSGAAGLGTAHLYGGLGR